ncbi:MAG TPA: cytochrome c [Candidatus Binatia bacterium]
MKRFALSFGLLGALILAAGRIFSQESPPKDWEQKSYVERGGYLVNHLAECIGCHTPLGPGGPSDSDMNLYLSGVPAKFTGVKAGPPQVAGFPGPKGAKYYPKNITPDAETGIGNWSEEQFVRAFKERIRPDGTRYDLSDMPWDTYKNMKEEDVRAIYRYLKTIKPISNRVPENIPPQ